MKHSDVYIRHILDAIADIESYVEGCTEEEFFKPENKMRKDAVVRQLEIIGEASKRLTDTAKDSAPHVPWRQIGSMRDKLIHEYFGVDLKTVWNVVQDDLPELKKELAKLV